MLDALLETEAGAAINRHHVDGGGVSDLVFALCHGLGFVFVPRIPDLNGRCLYGFAPARHYGVLQSVMGEHLDASLIRRHWDDILPLLTLLRTRTVSAALVLRQLIGDAVPARPCPSPPTNPIGSSPGFAGEAVGV